MGAFKIKKLATYKFVFSFIIGGDSGLISGATLSDVCTKQKNYSKLSSYISIVSKVLRINLFPRCYIKLPAVQGVTREAVTVGEEGLQERSM